MVYLERIWDSQTATEGYILEERIERPFVFYGWDHVYVPCGDNTICTSEVRGQSEVG